MSLCLAVGVYMYVCTSDCYVCLLYDVCMHARVCMYVMYVCMYALARLAAVWRKPRQNVATLQVLVCRKVELTFNEEKHTSYDNGCA